MNQRRKKRGFLLNRRKKSQKPSNCLRKQHNSCFSMHSHPFIFSIMCKCSYAVKKEHPNKPVEAPNQPSESQQQQRQPNVKDLISSTTLITKYDYSRKSEAAPSTPSKVSMIKRGKLKKRVTIGSNQTSTVIDGGGGGGSDEAEWPPSADEDYIVFCFEEDGEFHVVMEENSSPRPHNLKVEEERFYFSPRLQSDGIRSATRFKQEVVEYEGTNHAVESRGRVDEAMECKEMEEIKSRGQFDDDQEEDDLDYKEDVEFPDTSTECVHRCSESTDSSQSDWEHTLQLTEVADQETRLSSSSSHEHGGQIANKEANLESPSSMKENCPLSKKMADDEESVYLSSESQQGESQDGDEQSGRGSAETSDSTSRSEIEEEEQLEDDHEESARISVVPSKSSEESDRISSSSFEFPALQWEWIGSPEIWPRSETPKSIRFRKHKPRKVCLRLC